MNRLRIDPRFAPTLAALHLDSFAAVTAFFDAGQSAGVRDAVTVKPRLLRADATVTLAVYYKEYRYARPACSFIGRASKARCEYDNYARLAQLGIPVPARVAYGEDRDIIGRLRCAFIITEAVPNAQSLTQFVDEAGSACRRRIARQLAALTRRIHQAGFFHHDLVWRNILVTCVPSEEPQLWWIDCPRGGFVHWPPARRRRQLKDLASLDKSAARYCSRGERLRFLQDYLERPVIDGTVRRLARAVLAYRRRRWADETV